MRRTLQAEAAAAVRRLPAGRMYRMVPVVLVCLVASLAAELFGVRHENSGLHVPYGRWVEHLPLSVMLSYPPDPGSLRYHVATLSLAIVQSVLLAVYLIAMHDRAWRRIDTIMGACACAAVALIAIVSPAINSQDMYAYVADSLLGNRAYDPSGIRLPGEFGVIHYLWRFPLLPAAYGPTWLWLNGALLGLVHGLSAKLFVLRLENVAALGALLGALSLLRVAPRFIAATAVNPAIAFYYLCDGHNDLVVIAIILMAMTFAARAPIAAGLLAGIGGSMKLTFIVPAAAAALVIASLPKRLTYVAVMLSVAAISAGVWGGTPYIHALSVIAREYAPANYDWRVGIPHVLLAVATIALTGLALLTRRTFIAAPFGFTALAQAIYPWYAIWGFPYAVFRSDLLATFLIGLPIMTAVVDTGVAPKLALVTATLALLAVAGMMLRLAKFGRRNALEA